MEVIDTTEVNPERPIHHYPNQFERKQAYAMMKLVDFKDKMPKIKSNKDVPPSTSIAGYLVRFDNFSKKLMQKVKEKALDDAAKERQITFSWN